MPFENESNLKPLRRRLANFRFTVAMRRIPCIHFHSSACVRVLVSQHQRQIIHRGALIHTAEHIRGRPVEYTQLKEKSHVQTSCSPSSIVHTIPCHTRSIRCYTRAEQIHAHTLLHSANSPWTRVLLLLLNLAPSLSLSRTHVFVKRANVQITSHLCTIEDFNRNHTDTSLSRSMSATKTYATHTLAFDVWHTRPVLFAVCNMVSLHICTSVRVFACLCECVSTVWFPFDNSYRIFSIMRIVKSRKSCSV